MPDWTNYKLKYSRDLDCRVFEVTQCSGFASLEINCSHLNRSALSLKGL